MNTRRERRSTANGSCIEASWKSCSTSEFWRSWTVAAYLTSQADFERLGTSSALGLYVLFDDLSKTDLWCPEACQPWRPVCDDWKPDRWMIATAKHFVADRFIVVDRIDKHEFGAVTGTFWLPTAMTFGMDDERAIRLIGSKLREVRLFCGGGPVEIWRATLHPGLLSRVPRVANVSDSGEKH